MAQVIRLQNASFEGEPRDATIPRAWHICKEGSTPDILPGYWGVYLDAEEGDTYVGLITRQNGTWENIGQRLPSRLAKDKCYTVSLSLARADTYSGYNRPLKLRIWGGSNKCSTDQLLAESKLIENTEWERLVFRIIPENHIQYIILEAYHSDEPFDYEGNLLIDNISVIKPCTGA